MGTNSLQDILAEVNADPKEVKQQLAQTKREMTALKYNAAIARIQQIDEKIAKLQRERDNLVRKNENRALAYSKK